MSAATLQQPLENTHISVFQAAGVRLPGKFSSIKVAFVYLYVNLVGF